MQFVNIIELTILRRKKNKKKKIMFAYKLNAKKLNYYKFYNLLHTNKSIALLVCHQYYQVVQFQRLYL